MNDEIVLTNYVPVTLTDDERRSKNREEYNNFMKAYNNAHALCPNCGSTSHSSTYVGYILHMDKKDEYKDLNMCICFDCKNTHSMHDRVEVFNKTTVGMKIWAIHTRSELMRGANKDQNGDRDLYRFFDSKEKAEAELELMKNKDKEITGLEMKNDTFNRYHTFGIREFIVE